MRYDPDQVYQPERDTYLLLRCAQEEIQNRERVLEIGTGSGLIAASLTPHTSLRLLATDINPHAVISARRRGVEVIRMDCTHGLKGVFDLILVNPPYLPTHPEERIDDWLEYALDGGPEGRSFIIRFASEVGRILAPRGRILLLISSLTGISEVNEIFISVGLVTEIIARELLEDEELVVMRISRQTEEGSHTLHPHEVSPSLHDPSPQI